MRAVIIRQFGDPKDLKIEEVATPVPGDGQMLVEVKAAGINPSDVKNVAGKMHGTTLPRVPGRDFAGTVVRGPADLVGRDVWGTGGDIGFTHDGSHAQFILLPVAALAPKPTRLSMDEAGSAGLVYVTAWSAMVTAANVAAGETAVIVGATGGVGSASVQIAKARRARVIGAVRSDEDIAKARANGVDDVINTRSANLADAARSLTDGRGADVVFDTSGMAFADSVEAAALGGRVPIISAPNDGKATFNLRSIYRKELKVLGVDTRRLDVVASSKLLAAMTPGFESGQFTVQAGQPRPLSEAVQAYDDVSRGAGRVFLRPND